MSRRGAALFAAMCVIWGLPYLLIKVAVDDLDPTTLVVARTGLGAAVLLPVAAARGELGALPRFWRPLLVFTAVEVTLPWLLLSAAEQHLTSSLTGLLVAAVPLVGALLSVRTGGEALGRRTVLGLLVGIAGVATLVGIDFGGAGLVPVLEVAGVVVGYAVGPFVLTRYLVGAPSTGVIAVALGLTALIYAPFGVAAAPSAWPSAEVLVAVIVLALVCTALAFLVFFALIAEVGPVRATVITYVNPAVAVLLGVLLLDEPFTVRTAVGFGLVLAGSVLATGRRRTTAAATPITATPASASSR